MNKLKKTILGILTATTVLGINSMPTLAATDVSLDVKGTSINMTIPTSAPIIFNADGTNTVPTNFGITNNTSIAGVHLSNVTLDAKTSGWKLLDSTEDTKLLGANSRNIKFSIGKKGSLKLIKPTTGKLDSKGSYTFASNDIIIPASGSQILDFNVDRGAFTSDTTSANAFSMTLNFEFN